MMANKTLFSSTKNKLPHADSFNEAAGRAYKFASKHVLSSTKDAPGLRNRAWGVEFGFE
jgi:hypothetical protein